MGGDSRDNDGHLTSEKSSNDEMYETYHMKPVYEGYFYTIHWVSKNKNTKGNFEIFYVYKSIFFYLNR